MRIVVVAGVVAVVCGAALAWRQWDSRVASTEVTDFTEYGKSHRGAATENATFAAGCFWKLEHAMRRGQRQRHLGVHAGDQRALRIRHADLGVHRAGIGIQRAGRARELVVDRVKRQGRPRRMFSRPAPSFVVAGSRLLVHCR